MKSVTRLHEKLQESATNTDPIHAHSLSCEAVHGLTAPAVSYLATSRIETSATQDSTGILKYQQAYDDWPQQGHR